MIHLRRMKASEFPEFAAYFIPDYAAEISTNYDVDIEAARIRAEQEMKDNLDLGVDTPGQVLLCVVRHGDETNSPVGYLWCKPDKTGPSVFINDVYIMPKYRGNGYARLALMALEVMFTKTGHSEVRLRVAADNKRAQQLYSTTGYLVTGINMRKPFTRV